MIQEEEAVYSYPAVLAAAMSGEGKRSQDMQSCHRLSGLQAGEAA